MPDDTRPTPLVLTDESSGSRAQIAFCWNDPVQPHQQIQVHWIGHIVRMPSGRAPDEVRIELLDGTGHHYARVGGLGTRKGVGV